MIRRPPIYVDQPGESRDQAHWRQNAWEYRSTPASRPEEEPLDLATPLLALPARVREWGPVVAWSALGLAMAVFLGVALALAINL